MLNANSISIDRALLRRSNVADDGTVRERMTFLPVAGGSCWTDLYTPTGQQQDTGFVICHAYGLELLWLHRIERAMSRALAAAGYPVLAIHRRGFGDSSGSLAETTIASQTEDVLAGIDLLQSETGVRFLGLIAPRFGSVIASAVLGQRPVDRLLLMNPVLDGPAYFRSMIRDMHVISLAMGLEDEPPTVEEALAAMGSDGVLDVLGQPIYRAMYDEVAQLDVRGPLAGFTGDVLACQIAKRSSPGRELRALSEAITAAGGQCRIESVREPVGGSFGHSSQIRSPSATVLREVLGPVEEALAIAAVEWMGR